jgi:hypothetical protein
MSWSLARPLFMLWFLVTIESILSPFVLSLFLAYLFHPIVTKMETALKMPRWTSAVFIILISVALVIILLVLGLPHIIGQFEGILQAIGTISTQFVEWVLDGRFIRVMQKYGISMEQLRSMLTNYDRTACGGYPEGDPQRDLRYRERTAGARFRYREHRHHPVPHVLPAEGFPARPLPHQNDGPERRREQSVLFYHRVDEILGRYIRGTTIIAIFDVVAVSTGLWVIGIEYPLVLGILSGMLFFIPYFGFITILCVSAFVASLSMGAITLPVISTVSFLSVLHVIENYILTPKIIGSKIGLHPVVSDPLAVHLRILFGIHRSAHRDPGSGDHHRLGEGMGNEQEEGTETRERTVIVTKKDTHVWKTLSWSQHRSEIWTT